MYNTYIDIDISCVIVIIVIIIKVNIVRIHNNFPVLCKCIILTSFVILTFRHSIIGVKQPR